MKSAKIGATSAIAGLAVLAWAGSSTVDARVDFNPIIFLSGYATDNVAYATEDEPKVSDTSASLGVTLPVRHESRHGWLEFLYTGSVTRYDEATVFDYVNHLVGFRLINDPNPRTNLTFDACYLKTQDQDIGLGACTDLFTSTRTGRDLFGAVFEYNSFFARRWSWNFGLEAGAANFEPIEGFDSGNSGLLVEDKVGTMARVGVQREFGRRLSFGGSYGFSFVDQEISPNVNTHAVRLDIRHQATKRLKYRLEVGYYQRSSNQVEDLPEGEVRDQGVEFAFELLYGESRGYQLGPVRLDLSAGIRPTAGGAIQGTSTDVFVGTGLVPSRRGKWDWRINAQYAVRLPTLKDEDNDLNTFTGEAQIERSVVKFLGIRLRGFYRDQASDNPALAVSYYRVELGLAWYPVGRQRPSAE